MALKKLRLFFIFSFALICFDIALHCWSAGAWTGHLPIPFLIVFTGHKDYTRITLYD